MKQTTALLLRRAAVMLAAFASVTVSAQPTGDAGAHPANEAIETLVINGCPIWTYTR